MTTVEKQILSARPSLRVILPVVFWQTVVFAALNVAIAFGMYFWHPTIYPLVANTQSLLSIWAVAFGIVGVLLAYGLIAKMWERLRAMMLVGLLFKILWSIALVFRVNDGGTFLIAALFIGLALLQAVCIIYYLPPEEANDGQNT